MCGGGGGVQAHRSLQLSDLTALQITFFLNNILSTHKQIRILFLKIRIRDNNVHNVFSEMSEQRHGFYAYPFFKLLIRLWWFFGYQNEYYMFVWCGWVVWGGL